MKKIDKDKVFVSVNCWFGDRFCGRCCYNTEMILLPQDIEELERLGFPREYFVVEDNGVYRLRNIDGHCVFLDPSTNRCMIYEHRPLGCRLYPLVYDISRSDVIVDKLCPRHYEVSNKVIEKYKPLFREIIEFLREKLETS